MIPVRIAGNAKLAAPSAICQKMTLGICGDKGKGRTRQGKGPYEMSQFLTLCFLSKGVDKYRRVSRS